MTANQGLRLYLTTKTTKEFTIPIAIGITKYPKKKFDFYEYGYTHSTNTHLFEAFRM